MTSEKSPLRSGKDSGDFVPSLANPDGPLHIYQRGQYESEPPPVTVDTAISPGRVGLLAPCPPTA